jgi:hypothetical protein
MSYPISAVGRNPLYARHCDPTGNSVGQFMMLVAQLFQTEVESVDLSFEEMKLPKQAIQQETMMIADTFLQVPFAVAGFCCVAHGHHVPQKCSSQIHYLKVKLTPIAYQNRYPGLSSQL